MRVLVLLLCLVVSACSRSALTPIDLPAPPPDAGPGGGPTDAGSDAGDPCTDPVPETCNGRDDDCDLRVDEDLAFGEQQRSVVREDEGSTGDCTSCRWATGVQVFRDAEGFLVVWRLGFDGSSPQPNVYARRLDPEGAPLGAPFVLWDAANVTRGLRGVPAGDRFALAFCGRFGNDDAGASAFVDGRGAVLAGPSRAAPPGLGCGAMEPDVATFGERVFVTWTNNVGGDRRVVLDVMDLDGATQTGGAVVEETGDLSVPARLAVGHGELALVTGAREEPSADRRLAFHRFAPDGTPLGRRLIPDPNERPYAEVALAASLDGWLVVGRTQTLLTGRPVVRLDREGVPVGPPVILEAGPRWFEPELAPRPGGGVVFAGVFASEEDDDATIAVDLLDEAGRRVARWRPDPRTNAAFGSPDLVVDGAQIWVAHAEAPPGDNQANRVLLHRLGCVD